MPFWFCRLHVPIMSQSDSKTTNMQNVDILGVKLTQRFVEFFKNFTTSDLLLLTQKNCFKHFYDELCYHKKILNKIIPQHF